MDFPKLPTIEELNLKIELIAQDLGQDSKLYRDYENIIKKNFSGQWNYQPKVGIQLNENFELTGEVEELKHYAKLARMPDIDEITSRGRKLQSQQVAIQGSKSIEKSRKAALLIYKKHDVMQKIIKDKIDDLYKYEHPEYAEALDTLHQEGRKSYSQLERVAQILNNKKVQQERVPKTVKY